jgi:hypothetical protein
VKRRLTGLITGFIYNTVKHNTTATTKVANWIGRNHLKCVIEGKIVGNLDVTGRRGGRRKQLLDDLKETRGF